MAKPLRSVAERQAEREQRDALATLTLTERLLAHILIELLHTRAERALPELEARLRQCGLSVNQIAALLDTTPATLAVLRHRATATVTTGGRRLVRAAAPEAEK